MQRRKFLSSSMAAAAAVALGTGPSFSQIMSAPSSRQSRLILYVMAELVETNSAKLRAVVQRLGSSGFNVLVLSFLQARMANGKLDLLYNGNAVASFAPQVPALLARLRSGFATPSGFATRRRIQISIGGWGNTPTFAAIRSAGVAAFVRQLTEQVIAPLGLDGIDLDLEPQEGDLENWIAVHREYGKILVDLTNEYKRVHPTHLVTYAPVSSVAAETFMMPSSIPDLKGSLLQATRTPQGNNIDWLNVQFYEGGVVSQGSIADFYRTRLAGPLVAMREQVGISKPLYFFTPTFEPHAKQPLAFCQRTIAAINSSCADLHAGQLSGAALWDYQQIESAIGAWSAGLQSVLRS